MVKVTFILIYITSNAFLNKKKKRHPRSKKFFQTNSFGQERRALLKECTFWMFYLDMDLQ
jgi:hypothetical protein